MILTLAIATLLTVYWLLEPQRVRVEAETMRTKSADKGKPLYIHNPDYHRSQSPSYVPFFRDRTYIGLKGEHGTLRFVFYGFRECPASRKKESKMSLLFFSLVQGFLANK